MFNCKTLDDFLMEYGDILADKARKTLAPLHVPGRDKVRDLGLMREPFDAQKHVIEASIKQLRRAKAVQPTAEMGTGKTIMAIGAAHGYGLERYTNHARRFFPADGEAKDVKTYGPYIDVGEALYAEIEKAHTSPGDHKHGTIRIQPFTYRGKRYVNGGGNTIGVPGLTPVWNRKATCWEVTPAGEYKGRVVSHKGMEAGSPHRAAVMAGAAGVAMKAAGKKAQEWVLHSPRVFRNVCKGSYRALVVCPTTLVDKWVREVQKTVPGATVYVIDSYAQLLALARQHAERRRKFNVGKDEHNRRYRELLPISRDLPKWGDRMYQLRKEGKDDQANEELAIINEGLRTRKSCYETCEGYTYYVIGKDKLKLGSEWRHAYVKEKTLGEKGGRYRCPGCGCVLTMKSNKTIPIPDKYFAKGSSRKECHRCGEQLWQSIPKPARYSPAEIINRRLRGFWDIAIFDEAHEYKGDDSLQGDAMGDVAAAVRKCIGLTGTLVGGYAWHVRCGLYRMGVAQSLIEAGHEWDAKQSFDEEFGRIEEKVKFKEDNRPDDLGKGMTYGRSKKGVTTTKYTRPGIMPTLFRHLMGSCVFLSLAEVAENLPVLDEEPIEVPMDDEQRAAYEKVDRDITQAIKDMMKKGGRKALGSMLNCLLCYPDYPYDWEAIGYYEDDEDSASGMGERRWVTVTVPENLDPSVMRPKEKAAVEWCVKERDAGRQAWVYAVYTDKRDCIARLERFMKAAGLRVAVMRAKVSPREREAWIDAHGKDHDVIISHPQLVQTGLDFFNPATGHNYCSILFYQTGYSLFTLRQAARRAWRIGQKKMCKVAYMSYSDSMQTRAMALMGKKMAAAQALEGNFSSEGLAAMAGDDSNIEMALAKSLADNIKEDGGVRAWQKVTSGAEVKRKATGRAKEPDRDEYEDMLEALEARLDGEDMGEELDDLADELAAMGIEL